MKIDVFLFLFLNIQYVHVGPHGPMVCRPELWRGSRVANRLVSARREGNGPYGPKIKPRASGKNKQCQPRRDASADVADRPQRNTRLNYKKLRWKKTSVRRSGREIDVLFEIPSRGHDW